MGGFARNWTNCPGGAARVATLTDQIRTGSGPAAPGWARAFLVARESGPGTVPSVPTMHLRLLRLFLGFAAFAWGVSVFGVFLAWPAAEEALQGLGARPIGYDRMLDYWLRMASGAFALVGVWYLVLALRPQRYAAAIPWFGGLMVVEGVILLVHGIRLSLPPFPFWCDTLACLVGGGAILGLARHAHPAPASPTRHSTQ